MRINSGSVRLRYQRGMTLVELLVVVAILAGLAGIIYPAVVDSIQKSEAALVAQRADAIQKAKVQFMLDHPGEVDPQQQAQFSDLQPYLTRFGQPVADIGGLGEGTGGTFENLGSYNSTSIKLEFKPKANNKYIQDVLRKISGTGSTTAQAGG
jgi:prepilin-type N-terminal cleavage/methylation domain-containing protein